MRQHDRNGFVRRWDHGIFIHLNGEGCRAPLTAVGVSVCVELDPGPASGCGWAPGEVLVAATQSWDKPAAVPHSGGVLGQEEHRVPQTHIPEELVACGLMAGLRYHLQGGGVGAEVEGQESGKDSLSPCCASASELPNNGWKGDGKMGSVGEMAGHAPIACTLSLPDPGRLPPAGTSLGPQSHPCPHGSVLSHGPASPSLPKSLFPSLWKPEAQVSRVEKQFLPLKIVTVLFCLCSHSLGSQGCCHWGSSQVLWRVSLEPRATPVSMSSL